MYGRKGSIPIVPIYMPMRLNDTRLQPRRITVLWAVGGLERALLKLGESKAEQRVRDQFHQLLLALEREGYRFMPRASRARNASH